MTGPDEALRLVFTDLDGSLLDHHNYSYHDALPQLRVLERLAIPVIPATSKTRSEVSQLRDDLANTHPFITENGAAVLIPVDYFARQPPDTIERDGFWVREFARPRSDWLDLLGAMKRSFAGEFDYFFQAGTAGISRMTGLPADKAERANQRDYSEPVLWLGSAQRKLDFMAALAAQGASVQQGGRFLAVSGDCDKGRALTWLRDAYLQAAPGRCCHDLAVGDSGNDRAMLEAAGTALLVRSAVHDFPVLERTTGVIHSRGYGPAGWAEGVALWLHQLRKDS